MLLELLSFLHHFLEKNTDVSVLLMLVLLQMFVPESHKLMEITVLCAKIIFRQKRREY